MNDYRIDFIAKKIIITSKFQKQMKNLTSSEYKLYKQFRAELPDFTFEARTHKTPTKYETKKNGTVKCNQYKNLTYANMVHFMEGLPDSERYLTEFTFIREYESPIQTSRYTLIRKWFEEQFPLYRTKPWTYLITQPEVVKATAVLSDINEDKVA